MNGKNCVAIAADRRFGIGTQTIATDFQVGAIMLIISKEKKEIMNNEIFALKMLFNLKLILVNLSMI